jgi:TonB family protein
MRKVSKGGRRASLLLIVASFLFLGLWVWIFLFTHPLQPWWKTLTRESKRILGLAENEIPPEEKRIRQEVILKKMEEASTHLDWKSFAPEYPRPNKFDSLSEKERLKALKETAEFKEMDKELKEYLKKKEDLFNIEAPVPPLKDSTDLTHLKDRGAERAIERLLGTKEKAAVEKPLDENLRLGIKGPLAYRKILERPQPPPVKVKVEAEIELTFWVLTDGKVDRAIPSVKGDTELERLAIQYLKQWRFAPLTKDQPQAEQWGTIPIKFKLQ